VDDLAGGLSSLGLGNGDVIAIQLPNIAEFILSFLAITRIGGVMQTIHLPYRGIELEGLLAHSGARAVICLSEFKDYPLAQSHADLRDKLPELELVIGIGTIIDGVIPYTDILETGNNPPATNPSADDPKLILYTSGTTSSPKGVAVNSHPFGSNARQAVQEFEVSGADIILSAAPFSHLYGMCALQIGLCAGVTTQILPAFAPADFMAVVEESRTTMLFTGPAHNLACQQAGLFERTDLSAVRVIVCSGSACAPELAEFVDDKLPNGEFLQLWGMTETQAGTYNRPGDAPHNRYNTVGRVTPGNEIRVIGDSGEGELQIRGSSIFPGYYNNPEANAENFTDGWFKTGDLAAIDGDGYLRITGRTKDVINRGGVKFNPADVEALIEKMDSVEMCAIVPMKDDVLGERACVFVQSADGVKLTLEDITEYLDANHLAKNKWPEQLQLVDSFPLTPTNKVMKGRLKPDIG
ncbi:MAG: class I adenylate-forming enzyme family protein, partial [Pseudomonadota bacterium]|nr:class I adenylate-forming enzyme family protein [Pseudomonadota bacterium]